MCLLIHIVYSGRGSCKSRGKKCLRRNFHDQKFYDISIHFVLSRGSRGSRGTFLKNDFHDWIFTTKKPLIKKSTAKKCFIINYCFGIAEAIK